MFIIAFSGYARAGKDEAAKVLVDEFGFTRVAFADKLRQMAYALDPVVVANARYHGMLPPDDYAGPVYARLQEVINTYGWDGYKESPFSDDMRGLMQRLGTEAGREVLGTNVWVDAAFQNLNDESKIVITDCRFPNEAQAVVDRGGYVVRIERPGIGPAGDHASEHALADWPFDFTVHNIASSISEYHEGIRTFVDYLGTHEYFKNVIGD